MSDEALIPDEAEQRFRKAFDTLDAQTGNIFKRVMVEALSYEKLAIYCDLPLPTMKEQVRLGLRHLRHMMGDDHKSD